MEIGDLDVGEQAFISISGKDVLVGVEEQQGAVTVVFERCIPGMYYSVDEDGNSVDSNGTIFDNRRVSISANTKCWKLNH